MKRGIWSLLILSSPSLRQYNRNIEQITALSLVSDSRTEILFVQRGKKSTLPF